MSSTTDDTSALSDEQRFGRGLAKARKLAGWNQEEAAARCGVIRQTISAWENGKMVVEQARLMIDLMRQGPGPRDAILNGAGVTLPTSGLDLDRMTESLVARIVQARGGERWLTIAATIDMVLRGMSEESLPAAAPRDRYGGA